MSRIYYFVFALIISNAFTYFLTSKSDDNISPKKGFSEIVLVQNSKDINQPKSSEISENSICDLSYVGNAILTLDSSSIRTSLINVLIAGWFEIDHIGLADWLNQQPEKNDTDQAIVIFSRLASRVDSEASLEWAASVSDEYLKEQTVREVAEQFRSSSPEKFYEYMANAGSGARLIASTGFATIPSPGTTVPNRKTIPRMDIIEEKPEPIELILARRVRLAGSSARENNVELTQY